MIFFDAEEEKRRVFFIFDYGPTDGIGAVWWGQREGGVREGDRARREEGLRWQRQVG